jgi:hypothetical protein
LKKILIKNKKNEKNRAFLFAPKEQFARLADYSQEQ